jgi:hypothetical protein
MRVAGYKLTLCLNGTGLGYWEQVIDRLTESVTKASLQECLLPDFFRYDTYCTFHVRTLLSCYKKERSQFIVSLIHFLRDDCNQVIYGEL